MKLTDVEKQTLGSAQHVTTQADVSSDPKHATTQADGSTATGVQMAQTAAAKSVPKKAAPSAGVAPGQVRMDLPDHCSKEAVDYVPLLDSAQEFRICQV